VLCISVLLAAIDNTIVNVALPTLNRRINASTADLQWIVTAYSLLFAGLLLVAGHLGDRMGRKRILQIGLVLFALTSLAAARSTLVEADPARRRDGCGRRHDLPLDARAAVQYLHGPQARGRGHRDLVPVSRLAVGLGLDLHGEHLPWWPWP
jgi:MFS transporter, DHA2 family, multidrug resistance protein